MGAPDPGSELAAARTRAVKVDGGWVMNGTKLWTTNAHRCQWMIALVRTSDHDKKHKGLSQLIVDLHAPGRSEEHTSELQSRENLVCRLLLEKKKHLP